MGNACTSAEDWRRATDLIADMAAATSCTEAIDAMLHRARVLFGADLVVFTRYGAGNRAVDFRVWPDIAGELAPRLPAFVAHFPEHPWSSRSHFAALIAGRVALQSDVFPARRLVETGLWREVYAHLFAKHQLGFGGTDGRRSWTVGLNRLGRDYGARHRELALFLQPRLSAMLRVAAQRDRASAMAQTLRSFFEHGDAAYAFLTPDGKIAEASSEARALFPPGGPVTAAGEGQIASLTDFITAAKIFRPPPGGSERMFFPVRGPGETTALVLRFQPGGPALVIFQKAAATPSAIRLTHREAEILHQLAEGGSHSSIATLLRISPRTVEKHCTGLYAKLGVDTRLAAALVATQLPF